MATRMMEIGTRTHDKIDGWEQALELHQDREHHALWRLNMAEARMVPAVPMVWRDAGAGPLERTAKVGGAVTRAPRTGSVLRRWLGGARSFMVAAAARDRPRGTRGRQMACKRQGACRLVPRQEELRSEARAGARQTWGWAGREKGAGASTGNEGGVRTPQRGSAAAADCESRTAQGRY